MCLLWVIWSWNYKNYINPALLALALWQCELHARLMLVYVTSYLCCYAENLPRLCTVCRRRQGERMHLLVWLTFTKVVFTWPALKSSRFFHVCTDYTGDNKLRAQKEYEFRLLVCVKDLYFKFTGLWISRKLHSKHLKVAPENVSDVFRKFANTTINLKPHLGSRVCFLICSWCKHDYCLELLISNFFC